MKNKFKIGDKVLIVDNREKAEITFVSDRTIRVRSDSGEYTLPTEKVVLLNEISTGTSSINPKIKGNQSPEELMIEISLVDTEPQKHAVFMMILSSFCIKLNVKPEFFTSKILHFDYHIQKEVIENNPYISHSSKESEELYNKICYDWIKFLHLLQQDERDLFNQLHNIYEKEQEKDFSRNKKQNIVFWGIIIISILICIVTKTWFFIIVGILLALGYVYFEYRNDRL